jgi:hypothetical protein
MWSIAISFIAQKALPWIWHQIARAWGVFLVGAVIAIILLRFHAFKLDLYNQGYKKGYSQALTDHPTNTVSSGGTVNYFGDKSGWIDFKMFRIIRVIFVPAK